jgi:phospholipase/lecithinase/hemolysin
VTYVSLRNLMLENHLSDDGVHPLTSGHSMIAEKVLETMTHLDSETGPWQESQSFTRAR